MAKFCNICGKEFDALDYLAELCFEKSVGEGSAYSGKRLSLNMCRSCFDRLMGEITPKCSINPLHEDGFVLPEGADEMLQLMHDTPPTEGLKFDGMRVGYRPWHVCHLVEGVGSAEGPVIKVPTYHLLTTDDTIIPIEPRLTPVIGVAPFGFKDVAYVKAVVLQRGVDRIYRYSFENCSGLKAIYLPRSLRRIDRHAFLGCDALTDIYYEGNEADFARIYIEYGQIKLTSYGKGARFEHVYEPFAGNEILAKARIHYNCSI